MSFQVGDVVVLKSGGPPMTVEKTDQYSVDTMCVYFDYSGIPQRANMKAPTLVIFKNGG